MADVTTETTTDTVPAVTTAEPSGVLDLRPPKESVRADESRPHPHLGRIEGGYSYRHDDRRRLIQHSNFFNPCNPIGLWGFRI